MTYITEEDEFNLDKGKQLILKRGNKSFTVDKNNIYCYGTVDFTNGSDDMNQIATFSFLDYLGVVGIHIPSDYHYDTHECHSPIKCCRWTETFKPEVLAQYAHGCLDKPERIVLFVKRW